MQQLFLLIVLLLFCSSCSSDPDEQQEDHSGNTAPPAITGLAKGCRGCHDMTLDSAHSFECTVCHKGNNDTADKDKGHMRLIAQPAHPDNMMDSCGKCHKSQVLDSAHSLHFTVKKEVNMVRFAFGAEQELESLLDIPAPESPATPLELADDLLRRRCLRCHVYYSGDGYPATSHGTGCASCHLSFYEGKLQSHSFLQSPGDEQCLQCHYGNRVGFDYYGRFEHDFNDEYRTPYTTRNDYFRPYGVEYHQLEADIHQQRGLGCVDCHHGTELMAREDQQPSCAACHDEQLLQKTMPSNISKEGDSTYSLLSLTDNKNHPVPLMRHPAHQKYNDVAGCQVCHARWTFNDNQTHLLRSDAEEYDDFVKLTVQGSFELESILENNLDFELDEIEPAMRDKINGQQRLGLWHKGYGSRRWENVLLGRDSTGKLQVVRPLLDLYLSWIDADEDVRFDSEPASAKDGGMVPYTPHTTGKAGLFYEERIEEFLRSERKEQP